MATLNPDKIMVVTNSSDAEFFVGNIGGFGDADFIGVHFPQQDAVFALSKDVLEQLMAIYMQTLSHETQH